LIKGSCRRAEREVAAEKFRQLQPR
jgi:hypothetical protein